MQNMGHTHAEKMHFYKQQLISDIQKSGSVRFDNEKANTIAAKINLLDISYAFKNESTLSKLIFYLYTNSCLFKQFDWLVLLL